MPTNVTFLNSVNDLVLTTTPPATLDRSHYTISAGPILAQHTVQYLSFDRKEGITNGKTFVFTTTFALGTIQFTITISMTGTLTDSNFWIQGCADGQCTPKITDSDGIHTVPCGVQLPTGQLSYGFSVQRIGTSGHDDVQISLVPTAQGSQSGNFQLPPYDQLDFIPLLDVWGEGRVISGNDITGFRQAYNLNLIGKKVGTGTDPIPNFVPVTEYANPVFPIASNSVMYLTVIGSPITPFTAREMQRVINKNNGVVFLYAVDQQFIDNFEAVMAPLVAKPLDQRHKPFDEVTMTPVKIYGIPGHQDHDEL